MTIRGAGYPGCVIDLKFLRDNPDVVRDSQRTRGEDPALVDRLLEADVRRREAIASADALRAEQKGFGKKIGAASKEERPALLEEAKGLSGKVKAAEAEQRDAEAAVHDLQMKLDNIVEGAPAGGEDDEPSGGIERDGQAGGAGGAEPGGH